MLEVIHMLPRVGNILSNVNKWEVPLNLFPCQRMDKNLIVVVVVFLLFRIATMVFVETKA